MTTFISRVLLPVILMAIAGSSGAQSFTETDVRCLAKNIAYEAPDESYSGKLAVATVTMNRLNSVSFPKTVCEVVYQQSKRGCQFSWVCKKQHPIDPVLYAQVESLARSVLFAGERLSIVRHSLFYHSVRVFPSWSRERKFITRIGAHFFYA